jgi:hypothetical protein
VKRLRNRLLLALEVVAAYVYVRMTMRGPDIRQTLARLREGASTATPDDMKVALRLARAVDRTLAFIPRRSRCLVKSLVLTKLLARRGIDSSLLIAVAPGPQLEAHAWLEAADFTLLQPATSAHDLLVRL